jgi:hypothetical protein
MLHKGAVGIIKHAHTHTHTYTHKHTHTHIYIYKLTLFISHFYIMYLSLWPHQQKLKLLMPSWIKPFKLLMVAKISTSNHSNILLSCIVYLKNITTKLYMHGVNWQFLARSPDTLCGTISVKVTNFFPPSLGHIADRNIDNFQLPYNKILLLYHSAIWHT